MDTIPAFVNPNTFVNPNVFVTPGNIFVNKIDNTGNHSGIGSDINLNGISDQSESDYKSEYNTTTSSTMSNSNAMDLINKFQNLSLKLN